MDTSNRLTILLGREKVLLSKMEASERVIAFRAVLKQIENHLTHLKWFMPFNQLRGNYPLPSGATQLPEDMRPNERCFRFNADPATEKDTGGMVRFSAHIPLPRHHEEKHPLLLQRNAHVALLHIKYTTRCVDGQPVRKVSTDRVFYPTDKELEGVVTPYFLSTAIVRLLDDFSQSIVDREHRLTVMRQTMQSLEGIHSRIR